jgi:hypothetical protein
MLFYISSCSSSDGQKKPLITETESQFYPTINVVENTPFAYNIFSLNCFELIVLVLLSRFLGIFSLKHRVVLYKCHNPPKCAPCNRKHTQELFIITIRLLVQYIIPHMISSMYRSRMILLTETTAAT